MRDGKQDLVDIALAAVVTAILILIVAISVFALVGTREESATGAGHTCVICMNVEQH